MEDNPHNYKRTGQTTLENGNRFLEDKQVTNKIEDTEGYKVRKMAAQRTEDISTEFQNHRKLWRTGIDVWRTSWRRGQWRG